MGSEMCIRDRYNNLKSLLAIDAERKRLEIKRRILVLSEFRLDSGAPKESVLKLFPEEKRLVTQAVARQIYESKGHLLFFWNNQLTDIKKLPKDE